jgi:hypothetical protein
MVILAGGLTMGAIRLACRWLGRLSYRYGRQSRPPERERGTASWYGERFQGLVADIPLQLMASTNIRH